jgi:hypothetical protein
VEVPIDEGKDRLNYKPVERLKMSDERSVTSTSQTNKGNGNGNKKNFQRPRDPIGIKDLRGYYYVYGKTTQAQAYHRTTRAMADYAAQNIDSGKEMYRLIYGWN